MATNIKRKILNGLFSTLCSKQVCLDNLDIESLTVKGSDVLRLYKTSSGVLKLRQGFFRTCLDNSGEEARRSFYNRLAYYIQIEDNVIEYIIRNEQRQSSKGKSINIPQMDNARRIMSTEAIANILGLSYMIPHSKFVRLKIEDLPVQFGTLMETSDGIYPLKLGEKLKNSIAPAIQCHLLNLNILDAICYEKDHRPGNYNIILNNYGKAESISAFDNDCQWTFFPAFNYNFSSYLGSSSLVKKGHFNRPYLDKNLYENMQQMTKVLMTEALSPYLNTLQIAACWYRFRKVRQAINRSFASKRLRLLEVGEWDVNTMKVELSGKYGDTYLSILYNWYETACAKYPQIFTESNFNLY